MLTDAAPQQQDRYRQYDVLLLKLLTGLTLFCVAFRLLAPAMLLLLLCSVLQLARFRAPLRSWIVFGCILAFFALWYLFGLSHFERGPGKFTNLVLLMVFSFIVFFVLGYQETRRGQQGWINFFSVCSIVYVLIVCVWSALHGYPGYNLVYDVINRSEENSPLYALQLVLFTLVWLNNHWHPRYMVVLMLLTLVTFAVSAVYLGSRAAFILLVLFFAFKLSSDIRRLLLAGLLVLLLGSVALLLGDMTRWSLLLDFGGFAERGVDSPRFSMLQYGFSHFLSYPTGGMVVQADGYTGIWFHNMLLDLVRVSGFPVMIIWLSLLLFTGVVLVQRRRRTRYLIIFILLNIALMQDLAFDGFFNIMALEFYLLGHAVALRYDKKRTGMRPDG